MSAVEERETGDGQGREEGATGQYRKLVTATVAVSALALRLRLPSLPPSISSRRGEQVRRAAFQDAVVVIVVVFVVVVARRRRGGAAGHNGLATHCAENGTFKQSPGMIKTSIIS